MPMNHELLITGNPYSAATLFGGVTDWYQSQVIENQWVSNDELEAPEAAPQFLGQAPPSPDYVPGPEHPPSPDYVPGPEEPEQPLPDDASPTALSPAYVADSDPEEDPVDYPANGGDDKDDESFGDDVDDEDEEEASNKEDDDEEEEEHLALADSSAVHIDDHVLSAEDTKAFETSESAPTPPSPRPRMARISIRPQTPMSAATEALIAAIPSPPLPVPSPPLPLPSPPTHTSPTYAEAPLGYKAAEIRLRATSPPLLLPSITHRDDILEADMPLWKRARFTAPASGFEDDMVGDIEERAPTTVEGLSQRVTDLSTTLARDTHEIYVRLKDAQDDRALQRARVNILFRDKRYYLHTVVLLESEARHAKQAWGQAMDCNKAIHAKLQAYRAQVQTHDTHIQTRDASIRSLETLVALLMAQTSSLQTQLTTTLREPAHTDDPKDAGSSS
ncbi:hypothetical protein Tco_0366802 [Tanacetum coccineum]